MSQEINYRAVFKRAQRKMCPNVPETMKAVEGYSDVEDYISLTAAKALMDRNNAGLYEGIEVLTALTGLEIYEARIWHKGDRRNFRDFEISLRPTKDMKIVALEKITLLVISNAKIAVMVENDKDCDLPIDQTQHFTGPNRVRKAINRVSEVYWAAVNRNNAPKPPEPNRTTDPGERANL